MDSETGVLVLKVLLNMAKTYKKTIIIVTHNQNIAKIADMVLHVKSGRIKSIEKQSSPCKVEEIDW